MGDEDDGVSVNIDEQVKTPDEVIEHIAKEYGISRLTTQEGRDAYVSVLLFVCFFLGGEGVTHLPAGSHIHIPGHLDRHTLTPGFRPAQVLREGLLRRCQAHGPYDG